MPYNARVYRILIASPSDVEEEREIAVRVIQEWNDLYSHTRQVVLLPLRWETHTAPDYGTRPQEIINRAIVDQCDLLLGIFWTRIGTPTGEADSGTLEEIERVANAGKPVMLYFSKIGIDPDKVNLDQMARLKSFKEQTYSNALIESYKSHIDFRDKLAKQLELKVRDLQKADTSDQPPPLNLQFISIESGELSGNSTEICLNLPVIQDLDEKLDQNRDEGAAELIKKTVNDRLVRANTFPVLLAISNTGSSGIRNLYVEMSIQALSGEIEVSDSQPGDLSSLIYSHFIFEKSELLFDGSENKLLKFNKEGLTEGDMGWNFSFEWDAIQPQRTRFVKPQTFIKAKSDSEVKFVAKVFADSFPQPISLEAKMLINLRTKKMKLDKFIPNLQELIEPELRRRAVLRERSKKQRVIPAKTDSKSNAG